MIAFTDEFQEFFPAERVSTPLHLLLRTEGLLLKLIAQWLQYTSMAAWNSVEIRNSFTGNPVVLNGFAFDLKAPTYLRPLARQAQKRVPGFLVADVNMSIFLEHEANAFVRKLSFIRSRKNPPAVLGLCFAEVFHPKAFKILREAGTMIVPLTRIGSQGLPELIRSVAQVFENVQAQGYHDFDKTLKAIGQLVDERETNMAGSIFELMVGRFLEHQGYTVRFFGKKVHGALTSGKPVEREVDVFAERGESIHLTEAKGYHRFQPVELSEVKRFLEETAPIAREALRVPQLHSITTYAFYTSSYFKKDAREYLESQKMKLQESKKLRLEFMDGKKLRAKWDEEGLRDVLRLLERYFGTRRKMVYDPEKEAVIEAPAPEFEQFTCTAPEPTEAPAKCT
jgi:Restriction endonuclease